MTQIRVNPLTSTGVECKQTAPFGGVYIMMHMAVSAGVSVQETHIIITIMASCREQLMLFDIAYTGIRHYVKAIYNFLPQFFFFISSFSFNFFFL